MHFLIELWMPIVLSAAFVFVVSSILHMLVPIHRNDCKKLPNEDLVLSDMRKHGVVRGDYVFPCAGSMKENGITGDGRKVQAGARGFFDRDAKRYIQDGHLPDPVVSVLVVGQCVRCVHHAYSPRTWGVLLGCVSIDGHGGGGRLWRELHPEFDLERHELDDHVEIHL